MMDRSHVGRRAWAAAGPSDGAAWSPDGPGSPMSAARSACGKGDNGDIKGGSDNDTLVGGAGNDDRNGGPGKDNCFGNGGSDDFKGCEKIND